MGPGMGRLKPGLEASTAGGFYPLIGGVMGPGMGRLKRGLEASSEGVS